MSRGEIRSTGSEDEVFGPDPDDRDESEDPREPEWIMEELPDGAAWPVGGTVVELWGLLPTPEHRRACRGCDGQSTTTWNGWDFCRACLDAMGVTL